MCVCVWVGRMGLVRHTERDQQAELGIRTGIPWAAFVCCSDASLIKLFIRFRAIFALVFPPPPPCNCSASWFCSCQSLLLFPEDVTIMKVLCLLPIAALLSVIACEPVPGMLAAIHSWFDRSTLTPLCSQGWSYRQERRGLRAECYDVKLCRSRSCHAHQLYSGSSWLWRC